jgi:hypothetical protein
MFSAGIPRKCLRCFRLMSLCACVAVASEAMHGDGRPHPETEPVHWPIPVYALITNGTSTTAAVGPVSISSWDRVLQHYAPGKRSKT